MNFEASTLTNGAPASLREPARDLRLADAGRADQDDVVGRDLVADRVGRALPAPAIAQRDRDGLLRVGLADDVAIELGDDLARRQVRARACWSSGLLQCGDEGHHARSASRTVMFVFV